ncbi:MAG TPA: ATP-binding protein [Candidatus Methanoperedens sp.]|nr:ATP-binding protein [Candidatus Methanoperedens sp.]
MRLISPPVLDEAGAEELLGRISQLPRAPEAIDCSGVRFADPCGALLLAAIGLSAPFRREQAWGLVLPREPAVRSWLARCGVQHLLEESFIVDAGAGDDDEGPRVRERDPVLLEAALVREGADIHRAVARIKARADLLLVSQLGYSGLAADRFTVAMAEICQNAVDHSGSPGVALAQCYLHAGGGPEIRLAVADVGIGVRASLAPRYAARFPGAWSDRAAIGLAFESGVTGSGDPDRGLGLAAVTDLVHAWGGTLRLRSGTAARVVGAHPSERAGLPHFPGTQVTIRLPHAAGSR